MRCYNSLCLLRFAFIALNLLVAFKLYSNIVGFETQPVRHAESLQWSQVDVESPALLNDSVAERMRINELIARPQAKCGKTARAGGEFEAFIVCQDKTIKTALTISVNSLNTGSVEAALEAGLEGAGPVGWSVVIPLGARLLDALKGDVHVHYLTEMKWWRSWDVDDVAEKVRGQHFDVLRMDLASPHFSQDTLPQSAKQIIQLVSFDQLLLTVPIGEKADVVGEWYRLLYHLFYKHKLAVVGATYSGVCGWEARQCRYRVTLTRYSDKDTVEPPVFNLGSPLEERRRLELTLSHRKSCSLAHFHPLPPYCEKTVAAPLLIRYTPLSSPLNLPSWLSSTLSVASPFNVDGFAKHIAIDHKTRLATILDAAGKIDLLLLDLEGGEWDVLPQLLKETRTRDIQQIGITGRIWIEENENYRRFYWLLYRLGDVYSTSFGRVADTHFQLVLTKH